MTALDLINITNDATSNKQSDNISNTEVINSSSTNIIIEANNNRSVTVAVVEEPPASSTSSKFLFINKFSKKYHLNRYKQEQKQLIINNNNNTNSSDHHNTPPHSPAIVVAASGDQHPQQLKSSSPMIIDCKTTNEATLQQQEEDDLKQTVANNLTSLIIKKEQQDYDSDENENENEKIVVIEKQSSSISNNNINFINVISEQGEEEVEEEESLLLPLIQTPPQSTASSISINDLARENSSSNSASAKLFNRSALRLKLESNHENLKGIFKNSYARLRKLQTKHFQTFIVDQLNVLSQLGDDDQAATTKTITATEAAAVTITTTTPAELDRKQIDLLTSIVKSNLKNKDDLSPLNELPEHQQQQQQQPENVTQVVKSLINDIEYELCRQKDEEKHFDDSSNNSITDDELTTSEDDENEIKNSKITNKNINNNNNINHINKNINDSKKLIDKSNWYWNVKRVQLGNEWERVQSKIKYLDEKNKQCDDYLLKIASLEESLQKSLLLNEHKEQHQKSSRCTQYQHQQQLTKKKNLSKFKLNRNDFVSFDDDALKSVYTTFLHLNSNVFKTMCPCCNGSDDGSGYSYSSFGIDRSSKITNSNKMKRTCILCHLMKKYDKKQQQQQHNHQQQPLNDQSNSIRKDHTYSKPPMLKRKLAKLDENDQEEDLLDDIVRDRLDRLFGQSQSHQQQHLFDDEQRSIDPLLFEAVSVIDEKLQLPDLTYEELNTFLNSNTSTINDENNVNNSNNNNENAKEEEIFIENIYMPNFNSILSSFKKRRRLNNNNNKQKQNNNNLLIKSNQLNKRI